MLVGYRWMNLLKSHPSIIEIRLMDGKEIGFFNGYNRGFPVENIKEDRLGPWIPNYTFEEKK